MTHSQWFAQWLLHEVGQPDTCVHCFCNSLPPAERVQFIDNLLLRVPGGDGPYWLQKQGIPIEKETVATPLFRRIRFRSHCTAEQLITAVEQAHCDIMSNVM